MLLAHRLSLGRFHALELACGEAPAKMHVLVEVARVKYGPDKRLLLVKLNISWPLDPEGPCGQDLSAPCGSLVGLTISGLSTAIDLSSAALHRTYTPNMDTLQVEHIRTPVQPRLLPRCKWAGRYPYADSASVLLSIFRRVLGQVQAPEHVSPAWVRW